MMESIELTNLKPIYNYIYTIGMGTAIPSWDMVLSRVELICEETFWAFWNKMFL